MTQSRFLRIVSTSLLSLSIGCGASTPSTQTRAFAVVLHAMSDDGAPVEGALFRHGTTALGTTDASGAVKTTISAEEGQVLPVATTCPSGYIAPENTTPLRLAEVRRLDPTDSAALGVEVVCVRKMRDVLLVVRSGQAAGLAVEASGQTIGVTDTNGNALVAMQLDRSVRSLSVSLDTAGQPRLRPQNPTRVFELDGQDAILLFQPTFFEERPTPAKRRLVAKKASAPAPEKHIPYRIDSGRVHAF